MKQYPRFYGDESIRTVTLSGSSKDRRKQLRKLCKDNPDCKVTLHAPIVMKTLNGERVECDEANVVRTQVRIRKK